MNTYSYGHSSKFREYLSLNESVLWCDKPDPKFKSNNTLNFFTSIFGIFWLGFSLFWTITAFSLTRGMDDGGIMKYIFPLFGVPFVLVGLYLVFLKRIFDKMALKKTVYAVTQERVLVLYEGKHSYVKEYRYTDIGNINLTARDDGMGSISFYTGATKYRNGRAYQVSSGIFGIKNAKNVYRIISEEMEKKKQ